MDTVKEVKEVRDLGGTGGAKMEKEYALVQGGGGGKAETNCLL